MRIISKQLAICVAAAAALTIPTGEALGSDEPGHYDAYARGRPTVLAALTPDVPEYRPRLQRVVEVTVTVTRTPVQPIEPQPAFNPHIIELEPGR